MPCALSFFLTSTTIYNHTPHVTGIAPVSCVRVNTELKTKVGFTMSNEIREQLLALNETATLNTDNWSRATQTVYDNLYQQTIEHKATKHAPDLDIVTFLQQRPNPYNGHRHFIQDLILNMFTNSLNQWYTRSIDNLTAREVTALTNKYKELEQKIAVGDTIINPDTKPTQGMLKSDFLTFVSNSAFEQYINECVHLAYLNQAVNYAKTRNSVNLNKWGIIYISQKLNENVDPFDTIIDDISFNRIYCTD